ncbi:NAD(P)H-hydrate dehydratase [Candidatus Woesearchaeota archaeon]|nr:NAD(P)H-hydrate dehydratase [Candidatus Woesearchaeota archaeon]
MKYISQKELRLPKRGSRKGENGRVLIIGGSMDYVGAPVLAGLAALRSGADWVTVLAPKKAGWAINCLSPDLVVRKVKGDYFLSKHIKDAKKEEKKHDVIVIGNGLGLKSKDFIISFVKKCNKPMVIDADALKAISINIPRKSILTPHSRELEILMKNSNVKSIDKLQRILRDNVIIAKGSIDRIITKDKVYYNKTGNAGMTKAGTGDVLAGLAAGFYAQTKDAIMAAKMAAYYNGMIGDILLRKKKGFTYLASDMVGEIKRICK